MKARDIALAALAFGVAAIGAGVAYATASPVFATYTVAAPGQTIDIWGNFEPVGSVFALSSSAGTPSPASVTADDQGRIHASVVVPATYSQVSVKVVATRTDTTAPDLIGYFPLAAASVYSVRYSVIAGDSASMTAAHFAVGETVRVSSPDAVASGQGVADAQGAVTLPVLIQEPVRSLSPTIVATGATSGRTATVRQRVYSSTLWAGSVLPYGDELIAPKRKVMLTVVSDAIQTEAEIAYVAPTTYSETVWDAGTSSAMLTPVRLAMQHDCNLVLYRNSDGRPLWSSGTYTHGDGCRAVIRDDASLVAYEAANRVVWSSGPWPDRLWAGQRLLSGRCKSSASLPASIGYRLCMQGDGNLVLYRRSDKGARRVVAAINAQAAASVLAIAAMTFARAHRRRSYAPVAAAAHDVRHVGRADLVCRRGAGAEGDARRPGLQTAVRGSRWIRLANRTGADPSGSAGTA